MKTKDAFFILIFTVANFLSIVSCTDDTKDLPKDDIPTNPPPTTVLPSFTTLKVNDFYVSTSAYVTNNIFTLSWRAIKGDFDIKSIKILCQGNPVTDLDGVLWDGVSANSQVSVSQKSICLDTIRLTSNTGKYYITAIDVNGNKSDTTYFIQINPATQNSCTLPTPTFGSVSDIDGNSYRTIIIGTQTWMVDNLKTSRYREGSTIINVTDDALWSITGAGVGVWCNYNNQSSYDTKYGKLYNWYAVNDIRGLAPVGWHVPTIEEWITLGNFLIANGYNEDGSITGDVSTNNKIARSLFAKSYWDILEAYKNNSSGFSALPSGYRYMNGVYYFVGGNATWWTSTTPSLASPYATSVSIQSKPLLLQGLTGFSMDGKTNGYAIRCVKD